jgi:REP element-mobilizing transposase RayT
MIRRFSVFIGLTDGIARPILPKGLVMADTFTQILFHAVFSTKHRVPLIEAKLRAELYPFMADTVRRHGGRLIALGGMPDHVHFLLRLKPYVPISSMVRFLKSNSSRWLGERPDLVKGFAWQKGYAAFSVSESRADAVNAYILNQEVHHAKQPYERELRSLLKRHRIPFDPSKILD